ncbi:MAG: hypothetical protein ACRDLZ_04500 [Gaiellaceae bacterium]
MDPKPLVGEREFDTASFLRPPLGASGRSASRDPDQAPPRPAGVRARSGRERMRGWGIAHALAWDPDEDMIACARWLSAA